MQAPLRRRCFARATVSMAIAALASPHVGRAAASLQFDAALLDIRRYVFVPSAASPVATVIDTDTDRIVGTLHTDIVARQVEVSRELAKLVATDGISAFLSIVDVFGGTTRRIGLAAPAQRLTLGTTGRFLAAADLAGGTITLIDLVNDRVAGTVGSLPKLRDVMFGDKDAALYIATEAPAVGVIDIENVKRLRDLPPLRAFASGVAALTRMPNGRRILARPEGGGPIGVLDVERGEAVDEIDAGPGTAGAFPSGTGIYLLVPDNAQATLAVFRTEKLRDPVALRGAPGVTGVYSAWLDSVAFVPSATRQRVLVYDLDAQSLAGEIALSGTPARGAVTADSRKLYLPVLDPQQVVVVDGESRRITATIDLPHVPLAAIVAGGWGICH
jgi:hypothetical protein